MHTHTPTQKRLLNIERIIYKSIAQLLKSVMHRLKNTGEYKRSCTISCININLYGAICSQSNIPLYQQTPTKKVSLNILIATVCWFDQKRMTTFPSIILQKFQQWNEVESSNFYKKKRVKNTSLKTYQRCKKELLQKMREIGSWWSPICK